MQFTISGSVDCCGPCSTASSGPSYRASVTGTVTIGDTSRTPLAALCNVGSGSVDLVLRSARIHISPAGQTVGNDVCFVLGARCTGTPSGGTVAPTTLDPSSPASVALAYRAPTGLSAGEPADGFLVRAQSASLVNAPPAVVIVDANESLGAAADGIVIPDGMSYEVTIAALNDLSGATVFAFIAEFGWDERA